MGYRVWPVRHRISASGRNQGPSLYWFYCRIHLPLRRRRALKEDMDGLDIWVCHQKGRRSGCGPQINRRRNLEVRGQITVPSNQQWSRVWNSSNRIEPSKSPRSQDLHPLSRFSVCSWPSKRRLWSEGRKNAEGSEDRQRTPKTLQHCWVIANPSCEEY